MRNEFRMENHCLKKFQKEMLYWGSLNQYEKIILKANPPSLIASYILLQVCVSDKTLVLKSASNEVVFYWTFGAIMSEPTGGSLSSLVGQSY